MRRIGVYKQVLLKTHTNRVCELSKIGVSLFGANYVKTSKRTNNKKVSYPAISLQAINKTMSEQHADIAEAIILLIHDRLGTLYVFSDWDDAEPILTSAIFELVPHVSIEEIAKTMLNVLATFEAAIYGGSLRLTDEERLGIYINELIETMLDYDTYVDYLTDHFKVESPQPNRLVLRGLALRNIARKEVCDFFAESPKRYFVPELYFSEPFI